MGTVDRSVLVRRPADDVAKIATDPEVVLPIIGGFGRFEPIATEPDAPQQWDLYVLVGTIYVGGRVVVEVPSASRLTWTSCRGTRHHGCIDVTPVGPDARITMSITVEFAGALTGWVTGLLAHGILARHLEAGLEQLRHHIEYAE